MCRVVKKEKKVYDLFSEETWEYWKEQVGSGRTGTLPPENIKEKTQQPSDILASIFFTINDKVL